MVLIFTNKDKASPKIDKEEYESLFKPSKTPAAIWPYSKAYKAWDLLFCSWQIPLDVDTMQLVKWWIEEQTKQVCRNLGHILEEYWASLKDVVKTTVFLKDINDFEKVNNIYKNYFVLKPARSTIEVSKLPKNALIEIEAIAKL